MSARTRRCSLSLAFVLAVPRVAFADEQPVERAQAEAQPTEATPEDAKKPELTLTPLGYVEAYYAYNFNHPSNGITNFRGFDNRHNTFSLQNVALGAQAETGPFTTRLILQVGSTGSTYYLGEPALPGASGANGTGSDLWKYVQEANVAWKAPVGGGVTLSLGLVPSPCGYETFAVKDNWNWSRSNLFFGLPFYHTGLRASYDWTSNLQTWIGVYNGWNSVVDNNDEKTVMADVTYKVPDRIVAQILYVGGAERPKGAPEGVYWRHHFDAYAQWDATSYLSLAAQGDYGFETNRIGTARWVAGALYARVKAASWLYFAARGDRFHEHLATDSSGGASTPIFWNGALWVSSGTFTVDARPHDNLSIRLEYRHDASSSPLFFTKDVVGDGSAAKPYVANASSQNTLLLGATAWF